MVNSLQKPKKFWYLTLTDSSPKWIKILNRIFKRKFLKLYLKIDISNGLIWWRDHRFFSSQFLTGKEDCY